ncbi:MAG: hypothetical protein HZA03_09990 [Nitrospinae bacterium]|nr:hypothetical protein [Nitrospinota bacterium]
MGGYTAIIAIALFLCIGGNDARADDDAAPETVRSHGIERRRNQFSTDFAYFVYPIAGNIPGLGMASGAGTTLANIGETQTDFTGFYVNGDFTAGGATLLDVHLIDRLLIFNTGIYTYKVAPKVFRRGIDSDKNDYILPFFEGGAAVAQLTLTFDERRYEVYARWLNEGGTLDRVLDRHGNEFASIDKSLQTVNILNLGFTADITDDVQDPRNGWRIEGVRRSPMEHRFMSSQFDTYDLNLTAYLPVGVSSTWAFNAFCSSAERQSAATTDRATLQNAIGLQCAAIPDPAARAQCQATETRFLDDRIAYNEYGIATPLGGTQRLRSYPNGRFFGGKAVSYGTELRWNITEERTLMDWFILRGLRTNLQIAFFGEMGSVAETWNDVNRKFRYSYGGGFRALFSGVTIRFDVGFGDEGMEMQLFLDYPWSVFSIDRPG